MTPTRKKAQAVAEAMFRQLEEDRLCIKQNIEEAAYNALLLEDAILRDSAGIGGDEEEENARTAAFNLAEAMYADLGFLRAMPNDLRRLLAELRDAAWEAGWTD